MAALAKPPDSTACRLLGGTFAVMRCGDIRGRRTGRVGEVEGIKETREVENRK